MAPLEHRSATDFADSNDVFMPDADTSNLKSDDQKLQAKERKLLFGCLDIFAFWSSSGSTSTTIDSDSPTVIETDACDSTIESESRELSRITPIDSNNRSSGSIVLHSIVSYPSSEAGVQPHTKEPMDLDAYLTIQNSRSANDNNSSDNRSDLSFSYSSFSEDDHSSTGSPNRSSNGREYRLHPRDDVSTGDESALSFDPKDFLEEDLEEDCQQGSPGRKKLGTIMEAYNENYSTHSVPKL